MLALNLLFALAWVAITGEISVANFAIGFGLSFVMLYLMQRAIPDEKKGSLYFDKAQAAISLGLYFVWTVVTANARMVVAVFSPKSRLRPAIVRIPLELENEISITVLANWITLTPGTLSLDVSDDFDALFVHTIDHGGDVEAFRAEIKDEYEARIKRFFE